MSSNPPAIAIIGAGPAACTLASLLAMRGVKAVVFDDGRRPEMLVGESLIPAVVPVLRRLGIEERVAAISVHKPGVSFLHSESAWIHFNFQPIAPYLPTYAYNVDRLRFDALLKERAIELGAVFVPKRARVVKTSNIKLQTSGERPEETSNVKLQTSKKLQDSNSGPEIALDDETLGAAPLLGGRQPDLIVDATGRARLLARLLEIGAARGPRDDVAYFAHYRGCAMPEPPGQVVIARLDRGGWSWRIPLPGKLSVGIVVDKETAKWLGGSPEERLENALHHEPLMADTAIGAQRISPVTTYSNYQLVSDRAFGNGWVAAGDAFGFVDPMLSQGLFLALESASRIDAALFKRGSFAVCERALADYERTMRGWFQSWSRLIDTFYDGRIFSLYEAGHRMRQRRTNAPQGALDRLINKHIACMAGGALTRARRSHWILRSAAKFLTRNVPPPAQLAIHRRVPASG